MFEYAISAGPGTLIEFGMTSDPYDFFEHAAWLDEDETLTVAPAPDDCETGK